MNWFNWFKKLVSRLVRALGFDRSVYQTIIVRETLPTHLSKHVLYIVEEDGYLEQAALLCPCGCGRILHMNLLKDERPCWQLIIHDDKTASLHPSVWRKTDCRSHFWIKKGKIYWV